jgi:hypothetical protein
MTWKMKVLRFLVFMIDPKSLIGTLKVVALRGDQAIASRRYLGSGSEELLPSCQGTAAFR